MEGLTLAMAFYYQRVTNRSATYCDVKSLFIKLASHNGMSVYTCHYDSVYSVQKNHMLGNASKFILANRHVTDGHSPIVSRITNRHALHYTISFSRKLAVVKMYDSAFLNESCIIT